MSNFACFGSWRCRALAGIALSTTFGGCVDDGAVVDANLRDAGSTATAPDAALADASNGDVDTGDGGGPDADAPDARLPDSHQIPPDAGAAELRCAEMASVCHAFDFGDGELGAQCHRIGHAGQAEACTPKLYEQCMAFCQVDSGALDASSDAAPSPVDAGHGDAGEDQCQQIGHLCHDLDTGADAGLAHECHEVGHAGDALQCAAIYDDCIALCAPDAEAPSDGG